MKRQESLGAAGKSTYIGRVLMNPVIGLDISKEESHGQAFLERGKPYKGTFHFAHTRDHLV
jgi:transposase